MGSVLSSPSASSSSTTRCNNDGGGCESNTALNYHPHGNELIMMNTSYDAYNTTDTRMMDGNSRETASAVVAAQQPQNFTSTMAGVIVVSSLTTFLPISATIGYFYWVRSQQLRQYNKQLTQTLVETNNGRRKEYNGRIRAERELKSTVQQCQNVLDQRRHERMKKRERHANDDDDTTMARTDDSLEQQQQQEQPKRKTKAAPPMSPPVQKPTSSLLQPLEIQDETLTHHHHYDERIAISPKLSRSVSQQGDDEIEVELVVPVEDNEEEMSQQPQHAQRDDQEDVLVTRQSFSYDEDPSNSVASRSRRSSSISLRPRRSMSNNNNFSHRSSITSEEQGLFIEGEEEARFLAPPSPPSSTSTSLHSRSSSIHSRSSSIILSSSSTVHSRSLSVSSNWSTATVASEYMMPTEDKVIVPYVPYEMKSLEDQEETANDTNTKTRAHSYLIESTMLNTVESPEQVTPIHKNKVNHETTPDLIQISTVSTELPSTSFDSTGTSSSWSVSTSEQHQQRRKAQHNIANTIKSPPSLSVRRNWKNETVVAREDNSKKSKNNYKKNLAEQQLEHPYMNNTARLNKKAEIRNKLVGRIRKNVTEKLAEQTAKGMGLELSLSPTTVFRTPMVRRKTQHYANIQDMEYMM